MARQVTAPQVASKTGQGGRRRRQSSRTPSCAGQGGPCSVVRSTRGRGDSLQGFLVLEMEGRSRGSELNEAAVGPAVEGDAVIGDAAACTTQSVALR
jgi:hypothetical protein